MPSTGGRQDADSEVKARDADPAFLELRVVDAVLIAAATGDIPAAADGGVSLRCGEAGALNRPGSLVARGLAISPRDALASSQSRHQDRAGAGFGAFEHGLIGAELAKT